MKETDALLAAAVCSYPEGSYENSADCYVEYRTFTVDELELMRDIYSMRVRHNKNGTIRVTVSRKRPFGEGT